MKRLAAALAALAALAAQAEGARWYLHADNDALIDTDRWYSSGLRLARVEKRGDHELEIGLLQEIYTAEGERFLPGDVDRAPTARLLASIARHDRLGALWQTLELGVGVRGPAAQGEAVTDLIHRVVSAAPIDWSRQERDRLDVQLIGVRTHHLDAVNLHYGAVAGNEVAFAHAGAELRFGARGLAPSPVLRYAATPPWSPGVEGWGGFVGASVRGVARNAMVKRPYSRFGEELERRKAVGRAAAGVAWSSPGFALTAAVVMETREFAGQRANHVFASFALHADF